MLSWNEYKLHSRGWHGEELGNFLFFRPLAYIVVKLTYQLPFNPNIFSLMGLITSLLASFALYQGTESSMFLGGLGILIFGIFDCCDGLLARMKKNSTPLGELIDMIVDITSSFGFFTCTLIGLLKLNGDIWYHYLIIPAGFLMFHHASIYHYNKKSYFFHLSGNSMDWDEDRQNFIKKLNSIPKHHWHKRFLIHLYLFVTRSQSTPKFKNHHQKEINYQNLKQTLPLWGFIAGSTYLLLLSFSIMANKIIYFLIYSFLIANSWMVFVHLIQSRLMNNSMDITRE